MNWRSILKIQGLLLVILSIAMLFPLAFSLYYGSNDTNQILSGIVISLVTGIILLVSCKSKEPLRPREGFVIVTTGWILASLFGALPFYFHEAFDGNFINCVFETMSGFTTTGATIVTDIESLPKGLLFWRSLTHWLGGMGIILLAIALLPILGLSSTQMFRAEVPGPTMDKISPKIKDTAKILWMIYAGMTVLETTLLMFGGMDLFNALSHTFGTLATGGFSTLNGSIAGFDSLYIEIVIMFFMYLAGINFVLHFHLIKGNFSNFLSNREWRFYTAVLLLAITAITLNIHFTDYTDLQLADHPMLSIYKENIGTCIRYASFQVVSITTTTGFVSTDFDIWPAFSKILLILLMFIGGSAGSTGGGIKQIRIMIILRFIKNEIKKLTYPRAYFSLKIGDQSIQEYVVRNVIAFFLIFMFLFAGITLFLTFMGYDIVTSFSATIATLGNIGPGLARVGAVENYAFFDPISKIVLIFSMLLGRLELYSVLILFYTLFYPKRLFGKMKG